MQIYKPILHTPKLIGYSQKYLKSPYLQFGPNNNDVQINSNKNSMITIFLETPYLSNKKQQLFANSHSVSKSLERQKEKLSLPPIDKKMQIRQRNGSSISKTPEESKQEQSEKVLMNLPKLEELSQNLFFSYATKTKAGMNFNKMTKINQDNTIVNPKIIANTGKYFFAVSDGHGINGHLVSAFLKRNLTSQQQLSWLKFLENISILMKDIDWNMEGLHQVITKAFIQTNKELWSSEIDTTLSGSTTVSILMKKDKIVSANVGDSRAILCRQIQNQWVTIPLTIDHKPTEESENKRILACGGRIEPSRSKQVKIHNSQQAYSGEYIGPQRVWLQQIDAPGLAMTRSFGDKIGAQAGVIAEPEILEFERTENDKFIVIASDGVWEYMKNEEVMDLIIPFYDKNNPEQAADKLIAEATLSWRKVLESLIRDDITCIIIFFK